MSDDKLDKRDLDVIETSQVLITVPGRNTLYRLLQMTGIDGSTFNDDTHKHAYNAGRRDVGIEIREELKMADKDNYFRMIMENENG